jgi:hypothetical protein
MIPARDLVSGGPEDAGNPAPAMPSPGIRLAPSQSDPVATGRSGEQIHSLQDPA